MRFQSSLGGIRHLFLVCLLLLCSTGSVWAQSNDGGRVEIPAKPDFVAMVADADVILVGRVVNLSSRMGSNEFGDQLVVSDVEIQPEEVLKGQIPSGQNILLNGLTGGTVPNLTMMSSEVPLFKQADRSFLFFEQTASGLKLIHGSDSKYDVDSNGNIREIGSSSDQLRTLILSLVTGSRIFLPLLLNNTSSQQVHEVSAAEQQTNLIVSTPFYALTGYRWPGEAPTVSFMINNPGFNDATAGTIQQQNTAIFNAANVWNTQSGTNFTIQINGDTNVTSVESDGVNAIIIRNESHPERIAEAVWSYDPSSNTILGCDIVFYDRDHNFSVTGQGDGIDIQSIAIHELGHCLGLDHSTVADSVLLREYAGVRQRLGDDDISGIRSIYRIGTANLWTDGFGYESEWRVEYHPRMTADVNGDDKADVVGFGYGGVTVSLSTGAGLTTPALWIADFGYQAGDWRVEQHPRMMADVNGDGRDDVIGFGHTGVRVALSTGASFAPSQLWVNDFGYEAGWRVEQHPRMTADVNGDGKADIVAFGHSGVYVSLATGSGFTAPQLWVNDFGYENGWRVEQHPRIMADVNGDGRDDVVGFGHTGVRVSLSTGTNFTPSQQWVSGFGYDTQWRVEYHPRMMADVNDDGKADVVGFGYAGVFVALSTGSAFTPPQLWNETFGYAAGMWRVEQHLRMMADANGDGKADVVGFGHAGAYVALSTGSSFTRASIWVNTYGYTEGGWRVELHPRMMADVTGDGKADVVGFGHAGVWVGRASNQNTFN